MKNIGLPITTKENECRRVIIPSDIQRMKYPSNLFFETGYGIVLGISDEEYLCVGSNIVSHEEALSKDIICDPKIGDADYLSSLKEGQIIFGWIHATRNRDIADKIINNKLTAYAWENMFHEGRHVFWQNNELAGEAAVLHACQCMGILPNGLKAAVIGKGNTARGALRSLYTLGAQVIQYDRRTEKLLSEELFDYDIIVNCVLWDFHRKDHLINREDLKKMKKNAFFIDVSCDEHGAIETSVPTTIENPIYFVDGIAHYVVDHTPAIYFKTFTRNNSAIIYPYLDDLISGKHNEVLESALIIKHGEILDQTINEFQGRKK